MLKDLPASASEVLLLRCLKSRGAKSVYIPFNRNGNQRRSAIVTFATEEEMNAAKSKLIRYNNHLVFWKNAEEEKKKPKADKQNHRNTENNNRYIAKDEIESDKKNKKEKNTEKKNSTKSKVTQGVEETLSGQMQELLQKILLRLDKLETNHIGKNLNTSNGEVNYS